MLKNHNSMVLYVVVYIFSLICPLCIFNDTCKQLKETTTATRSSTVTFHDQHCTRLKAVQWCSASQTK